MLAAWIGANALAQSAGVEGTVRDSSKQPIANAAVVLQNAAGETAATTSTAKDGKYHFSASPDGQYTIAARKTGYRQASAPVTLTSQNTERLDLTLTTITAPDYDEQPAYTVAGVSDPGHGGGHGSDSILRSTEKLAQETSGLNGSSTGAGEKELREATVRDPANADAFRDLGDAEERLGHPLEAARAFQRAAELAPTEPNLFAWGADLLKHRAPLPAEEVFAKGNHLFPKSVRMLLGLGAAWYAVGSFDKAVQSFFEASDLDTADPNPYLFLGRVQDVSGNLHGIEERLRRFAQTQPNSALANYYYAECLWAQKQDAPTAVIVLPLLQKAVRLDPKLAAAFLEEGTVLAAQNDFAAAIAPFQEAIAADPNSAQAHYRLAQAYKHTGKAAEAQREFGMYKDASKKSAEQEQRERASIPEFVFELRPGDSGNGRRPGAH
ncbi:MAG: carboxypeptidase regulatory-like domain-containing protein [Bryobacteraceae bacterium]